MDHQNVLRRLAFGLDPDDGETQLSSSALDRPEVIRALMAGAEALRIEAIRMAADSSLLPNAGQPWTEEEEANLTALFHDGASIVEMGEAHGRSRGAILSRLQQMGLVGLRFPPGADEKEVLAH